MVSPELEELTWIVIHGRGVLNTAQASQITSVISQAGVAAGREAYYYMRYDDSPERVQIPLIYYAALGKPDIDIVLPEEVEPVGGIFDAIAVLDSSMLVHPTSQRALLLDGAKKHSSLVVDTSLTPQDILRLIKKYNCAQDWEGKITTVRARKYHQNIAFGMLGTLARAIEDELPFSYVVDALEELEYKEDAIDAVKRTYEEAEPIEVSVKAEECEPFKLNSRLVERHKNLPAPPLEPWNRDTYIDLKKRAAEAPSYEMRYKSMPRHETLAPGLIEFNPRASERNIGFKTAFSRTLRPVINSKQCINCKLCHIFCPEGAIDFEPIKVDYSYCTGCGICANVCGSKAITRIHELKALENLDEEEILTMHQALIVYQY